MRKIVCAALAAACLFLAGCSTAFDLKSVKSEDLYTMQNLEWSADEAETEKDNFTSLLKDLCRDEGVLLSLDDGRQVLLAQNDGIWYIMDSSEEGLDVQTLQRYQRCHAGVENGKIVQAWGCVEECESNFANNGSTERLLSYISQGELNGYGDLDDVPLSYKDGSFVISYDIPWVTDENNRDVRSLDLTFTPSQDGQSVRFESDKMVKCVSGGQGDIYSSSMSGTITSVVPDWKQITELTGTLEMNPIQ